MQKHTDFINVMSLTKGQQRWYISLVSSLKICPKETYWKIGYWHYLNECFQAPGRQRLTAPSGSLKIRGQMMKSLADAVYPQCEKTQEMNSDLCRRIPAVSQNSFRFSRWNSWLLFQANSSFHSATRRAFVILNPRTHDISHLEQTNLINWKFSVMLRSV